MTSRLVVRGAVMVIPGPGSAYRAQGWVAVQPDVLGAEGYIGMFSPIWSGKQNRSDEEVAEWERQQAKLHQDYEMPWLSGLVTFSGFVAAFIGSVTVIFLIVHLIHGTGWLPYALIMAGLVGAHLCLRAMRYQRRRHARRSAGADH